MKKNRRLLVIAAVIASVALMTVLAFAFIGGDDNPDASGTTDPKDDNGNTEKPGDPGDPPAVVFNDGNPEEFKNGVIALDPATIGLAFRYFTDWAAIAWEDIMPTEAGQPLFDKLNQYGDADFDIHDTYADIQPEAGREKLNDLAEEHGFGRPFSAPFKPNQVGVASIVDKKMFWHKGDAVESTLLREEGDSSGLSFEAVRFSLEEANETHFSAYRLPGFAEPVVRIAADPDKSDGVQNYMWVTEISTESQLGFDSLFAAVQGAVAADDATSGFVRESSATIASITMPQLDQVQYGRSLGELIGTKIGEVPPQYTVDNAFQQVRVSVDELGAEAAAITGVVFGIESVEPPDPRDHIILGDQGHLLLWFTEGESDLPICIMVTNPDAWTEKQPDLAT